MKIILRLENRKEIVVNFDKLTGQWLCCGTVVTSAIAQLCNSVCSNFTTPIENDFVMNDKSSNSLYFAPCRDCQDSYPIIDLSRSGRCKRCEKKWFEKMDGHNTDNIPGPQ